LLLSLLLCVSACTPKAKTPEDQVRALIAEAQSAAEKKQIAEVRKLVSDRYADSLGQDKKAIEAILRFYFLRHQTLYLFSRIQEVKVESPDKIVTTVVVAMAGQPIPTASEAAALKADLHRFELTWAQENKNWLVSRAEWRRVEWADFL